MPRSPKLTAPQQRIVDALRALPPERPEGVRWHILADRVRSDMEASGAKGYTFHHGTIDALLTRGIVQQSMVKDGSGSTAFYRLAPATSDRPTPAGHEFRPHSNRPWDCGYCGSPRRAAVHGFGWNEDSATLSAGVSPHE